MPACVVDVKRRGRSLVGARLIASISQMRRLRCGLLVVISWTVLGGCTQEVIRGSFEKTAAGCFNVIRAQLWSGFGVARFCQPVGTRLSVVGVERTDRGHIVALVGLGSQTSGEWFWVEDLQEFGRVSVWKETVSSVRGMGELAVWILVIPFVVILLIFGVALFGRTSFAAGGYAATTDVDSRGRTGHVGWKGAWSEAVTKFFGGGYTQHRTRDFDNAGFSQKVSGFFGGNREQHYTPQGKRAGYSVRLSGLFRGEYKQHYTEDDKKAGYSQKETRFGGDERIQHYTESGEKAGYSRKETDWFSGESWEHYNEDGTKRDE